VRRLLARRYTQAQIGEILGISQPAVSKWKKQIERDRMNVAWLGEAADAVARHFEQTLEMLAGGPRLTSDIAPAREQQEAEAQGHAEGQGAERGPVVRPVVVIPLSGWVARDLRAPALAGVSIGFCITREWSGSVVPGMVAHGFHNGVLLALNLMLNG
jgi:transcriptional regulator with XRE-family HTH domain